MDVMMELFAEHRANLPPLPSLISDGDQRATWMRDMKDLLQAMRPAPRAACLILVANDLVTLRYPGMRLDFAVRFLCREFGMSVEELAVLAQETQP